MHIISLLPEHWPAVKAIYEAGLSTGNASFQTSAPLWEEWDRSHLGHSRLVAVDGDSRLVDGDSRLVDGDIRLVDGDISPVDVDSRLVDGDIVTGWAALTPVSGRCVYAGVAEVSVYISPDNRGQGVGKTLLRALITESEQNGIWTLQAGIFPENIASIRLHEAAGFRRVGYREKIGKMGTRWRDTILLERRSKIAGTDGLWESESC